MFEFCLNIAQYSACKLLVDGVYNNVEQGLIIVLDCRLL